MAICSDLQAIGSDKIYFCCMTKAVKKFEIKDFNAI